MSAKATRNPTIWSRAQRGRGGSQSRSAALPQHRVREPMLPENADHAAARPLSANRGDDEPGSRNVPISDTSDGTPNHSRLTSASIKLCGLSRSLIGPLNANSRCASVERSCRMGIGCKAPQPILLSDLGSAAGDCVHVLHLLREPPLLPGLAAVTGAEDLAQTR